MDFFCALLMDVGGVFTPQLWALLVTTVSLPR